MSCSPGLLIAEAAASHALLLPCWNCMCYLDILHADLHTVGQIRACTRRHVSRLTCHRAIYLCRSGRKRKQTVKAAAGGAVVSLTASKAQQMLAAAEAANTAQPAAEHETETL